MLKKVSILFLYYCGDLTFTLFSYNIISIGHYQTVNTGFILNNNIKKIHTEKSHCSTMMSVNCGLLSLTLKCQLLLLKGLSIASLMLCEHFQ